MSIDAELDIWRQQWQSETTVPLDLRRRVERQSRFMKIALIADILVTIVMGGGATTWAIRSPQPDIVLLAVTTWLFLAAAWTFALTNIRRVWAPSALDTAAFVELSIRRCRGQLAAIRFAACLFLCELMFCLGWVYNHSAEDRKPLAVWLFFSSISIDVVWLCTLLFFGFLAWYRRKNRAELAYLLNLSGQSGQEVRPSIWKVWPHTVGAWRARRGKRTRKA
jgi:hypothetical protein